MTDFKIKPDLWVEMAADRDMWRAALRKEEAKFERALLTKMEDKWGKKCSLCIDQICLVLFVTASII
jgi:hypothetical protein